MYCKIVYNVDILKDLNDQDEAELSNENNVAVPTKSKSADEILYINPDCATQILIDYIRSSIGIDAKYTFDLCNMNADLQNINDYAPNIYATDFLQPMETYICIIIQKNDEGTETVVPLISKKCSDLSLKLRKFHARLSKRISFEVLQKARQSATSDKYIRTIPSIDFVNTPIPSKKVLQKKTASFHK